MVVNTLNIINSQKIMRPNYLLIFIFYHTTRVISTYSKAFMKAYLKSDGRIFKVLKICYLTSSIQFSSVQSLSRVWLFETPWIAARHASLSITNSCSSLRLTFIESVMPSSHLILCHPLFLLPPIPPSIRVFSNESTLCMRWPNDWSFSFSIIPSKELSIRNSEVCFFFNIFCKYCKK